MTLGPPPPHLPARGTRRGIAGPFGPEDRALTRQAGGRSSADAASVSIRSRPRSSGST